MHLQEVAGVSAVVGMAREAMLEEAGRLLPLLDEAAIEVVLGKELAGRQEEGVRARTIAYFRQLPRTIQIQDGLERLAWLVEPSQVEMEYGHDLERMSQETPRD
jgi:hypothetical protein